MKLTTIRIKQDTLWRLGQLKYQLKLKTLDEVIRRLIEIATKFKTGYEIDKEMKGGKTRR